MKKFKSWFGHRCRELIVHLDWLLQPNAENSLVIFAHLDKADPSTNLRAILISKVLKKRGWRVTIIPHQLELIQRLRVLRIQKPKVILLQLSRHRLNRPTLYPGIPIVFDIDDAEYLDNSLLDGFIECCKYSNAVISGSSAVANHCKEYNASVHVVWTGTPHSIAPVNAPPPLERADIITWAAFNPMLYPVEAQFVKQILLKLAARTRFEFWLFGVADEQSVDNLFGDLRELGVTLKYIKFMPYKDFIQALGSIAVGLNPLLPEKSPYSGGKSFGKVLAYLVANIAMVVSDAVDHREFFKHGINGMIANDVDEWVESIYVLLKNKDLRQTITINAYDDFIQNLTTDIAAQKVENVLKSVITNKV